jgi:hypothetical protein
MGVGVGGRSRLLRGPVLFEGGFGGSGPAGEAGHLHSPLARARRPRRRTAGSASAGPLHWRHSPAPHCRDQHVALAGSASAGHLLMSTAPTWLHTLAA